MRVHLRKGTREDLSLVARWNDGTSPEFLMQWAGPLFRHPLTEEQLLCQWGPAIDEVPRAAEANSGEEPGTRFYAIVAGEAVEREQTVGVVELGLIDRWNRSARVARFLLGDPGHRGKGIGTEALRRLLEICFHELELHRVSLAVFDFNETAIRCYERVGFRKEGLIRESRRIGEEYWSYFEMGILSSEFECDAG